MHVPLPVRERLHPSRDEGKPIHFCHREVGQRHAWCVFSKQHRCLMGPTLQWRPDALRFRDLLERIAGVGFLAPQHPQAIHPGA